MYVVIPGDRAWRGECVRGEGKSPGFDTGSWEKPSSSLNHLRPFWWELCRPVSLTGNQAGLATTGNLSLSQAVSGDLT